MEPIAPSEPSLFTRFNRWISESIMVKLFSIGFLIIILLIPSVWIQDLIAERETRADQVIDEVADKWSDAQTVSGPILVVPYRKREIVDRGKDGKEIHERIERAFFLPEQLDIDGTVNPEVLHRGIFDAVVYQSSLKVKSVFGNPDFNALSIPADMVEWKGAYMIFGLSDHRGITDSLVFNVGGKDLNAEPSNNIGVITKATRREVLSGYNDSSTEKTTQPGGNGIIVPLGWTSAGSFTGNVSISLALKGSRRLDFVPSGKTTTVKLNGPWSDPSFDGEFLPEAREVTESGFTASWKILHFNRPFAQQWVDDNHQLNGADFGMKLLMPVDQYQKSMRTSKYGVLVILLTFISLFLVEITQKVRIHPFQYILIGVALIIYYTLLLSFSEHIGYNIAYVIASLATIALISIYSTTFLTRRLSILVSLLLTVFYGFIFVIILQQDFSLLIGSIGLFLIIGLLMYFSRKVNWYKESPISA